MSLRPIALTLTSVRRNSIRAEVAHERGIQIPVQHQTTLRTVKSPIREGQFHIQPPTPTAPLAGRFPLIGQDQPSTIPGGFIEQLPLELVKADIADGLRQMMVLEHPTDVEVFDHQDRLR